MSILEKTLILMRGVPSAGKTYRANELSKELGGNIYSTDEYWYKVRNPDKPDEYSFNPRYLGDAHHWNQLRVQKDVEMGQPVIIVDNTNTTLKEMQPYIDYAVPQDYKLRLEEPTSPWWLEIAPLLENKKANEIKLKNWAVELAEKSKTTHGVPAWAIERMFWRWELTETILRSL